MTINDSVHSGSKLYRGPLFCRTLYTCDTFFQDRFQLGLKRGQSRVTNDVKRTDALNQLPSLHSLLQCLPYLLQ